MPEITPRTHRTLSTLVLLLAAAALAACGGFRRGWESVATLESVSATVADATSGHGPPRRPGGRRLLHPTFDLPGVRLSVSMDNTLRTNDVQLYLFVLPLYWNPRDVFTHTHDPLRTRVFVRVTPLGAGWVLRPARALLHAHGRPVAATGGGLFEETGGSWRRRPVGDALALTEVGRTYDLTVDFPMPAMSPRDSTLVLDLADALVPPAAIPTLPRIRFRGVPWREGYS